MDKFPSHFQRLTEGLPADKKDEIEEAIATSPYLQQRMTQAMAAGQLEHIRLTAPGANEGGHYDSDEKAIYVSVDTYTRSDLKKPRDRIDVITSTLGHETSHALNTVDSRKTLYFVTAQVTEEMRAAGPGGSVDVTPLFAIHQRAARRDEAMAEIEGWNALASRIQHTNGGHISRMDMLDRAKATTGCVKLDERDIPHLAPGIILDQDMHMADTRLPKAGAINVDPVAQCHFDQSAKTLGAQGKADYRNYYGAYLIEQIGQDTAAWIDPPTLRLDMGKLGLEPAQLESTRLNLGGRNLSLVDTSQGQRFVTLRHTGDGIKHTPDETTPASRDRDIRGFDPDARTSNTCIKTPGPTAHPIFADPDHPQHALYSKLKAHLPDYTSETRLSQFTAECHLAGITSRTLASIHIEDGQAAFAAREGWSRAALDIGKAPPSVQESVRRAEVHDQNVQEQAPLRTGHQQAPMMAH